MIKHWTELVSLRLVVAYAVEACFVVGVHVICMKPLA